LQPAPSEKRGDPRRLRPRAKGGSSSRPPASQYYLMKKLRKDRRAGGALLQRRRHGEVGAHDLRPGAVPRQRLRERGEGADEKMSKPRNGRARRLPRSNCSCSRTPARKSRTAACYGKAMENARRPLTRSGDYWLSVIYSIATRPGFSERLALDVARHQDRDRPRCAARMSTWTRRSSRLQDGFPNGRRSEIIDKGYASGVLGTGPEARATQAFEGHGGEEPRRGQESARARRVTQPVAAKDGRALFQRGLQLRPSSANRNRGSR